MGVSRHRVSSRQIMESQMHTIPLTMIAALVALGAARANVITDWDEKAIVLLKPVPNYPAEPTTSKEAAAAAAAAAVLATLGENAAAEMKVALANYLAAVPEGVANDQ